MKDNRKTFKGQRIAIEGTWIDFDGKYDPDTDTLKVYRIHGNVSLFDKGIQTFCVENNFGKAVGKPLSL